MRAFLAAVVLTLVPSSLFAATIEIPAFEFPTYGPIEGYEDHTTLSYDHPFVLEGHAEFPGFPCDFCGEEFFGVDVWFPTMSTSWETPGFDLAIGTPEIVFLDVRASATITWTIDPPDALLGGPHLFWIGGEGRTGIQGYGTYIWPNGCPDCGPYDWTQPITWASSHTRTRMRTMTFVRRRSGTSGSRVWGERRISISQRRPKFQSQPRWCCSEAD